MNETIYFKQRQEGYKKVLTDIQTNAMNRTDFENSIIEKIYRWWAEWKPDYEGWLKIADRLYADECVIDAIGDEPNKDTASTVKCSKENFKASR